MIFEPDKPYKSIGEQIEILKSRNLIILNDQFAYDILADVGYYTLINGYGKIYQTNDKFQDNVLIEHIVFQYLIDETIKKSLFNSIINIESLLKNKIAEIVSREFGVYDLLKGDKDYIDQTESYLSKNNYENSNERNSVISNLRKTRNKSKNNPTKFYRENKNHVPPWILFKNISFWDINYLYKMLPPTFKNEILSSYSFISLLDDEQLKKKQFFNMLELLRQFRNSFAHGNRAYMFKSKHSLDLKAIEKIMGPNVVSSLEYSKDKIAKNDLYSLIISITILIGNKEDFKRNLIELDSNLKSFNIHGVHRNPYEDFLIHSKLPSDWIDRLINSNIFKAYS
ncbi:Abi family protein [Vagococcus fluvialis]|uniref:Abi family protein n=1 Tax=Vagococcus fluvialis TaxID=2738 RepID=UPI000B751F66|nr:Abi family protein [Vagococcus fluvialis]MBO0419065.1 Abi family protein [Vagococcus fluvialis]OTP29487.1 hypothetical protein A5798_002655 [Enterococcus sp. 6C8_DIV0013]